MSARSGLSTKGSGLLSEESILYERNVRSEQEKLGRNWMVVLSFYWAVNFLERLVRQRGLHLAPNYVQDTVVARLIRGAFLLKNAEQRRHHPSTSSQSYQRLSVASIFMCRFSRCR